MNIKRILGLIETYRKMGERAIIENYYGQYTKEAQIRSEAIEILQEINEELLGKTG